MLRLYLARFIKMLISIIPKKIRNILKHSLWLTSFYSRFLQRSGLFYGFPSRKKLDALYGKCQIEQQRQIFELGGATRIELQWRLIVVVTGDFSKDSMLVLCQNILQVQGAFHSVVFWCDESKKDEMIRAIDAEKSSKFVIKSNLIFNNSNNIQNIFIENTDLLHPSVLNVLSHHHNNDFDLTYFDCDNIDENNHRTDPSLFPDWNPDLQLTTGYISTGLVVKDLNNFLNNAPGSLPSSSFVAEAVIGCFLQQPRIAVNHVPLVLLHRTEKLKPIGFRISKLGQKEIKKFCNLYEDKRLDLLRLSWPIEQDSPLVSLIIPTKNRKDLVKSCIESILKLTTYKNYEILLIDNGSQEIESLNYFKSLEQYNNVKVLKYNYPFNYSSINNFAVEHSNGSIVGLINNDIEVISPTWLELMVGHIARKDVGCVGAKLLYSDERVQHAGVVLGYGGGAGHAHKYFPRHHPGYQKRLAATNNFSAVTAACLLVKKKHFIKVGGLNEKELSIAFNDVDFCLKIHELGLRNVYCAEAELFHHESVSRGIEDTREKKNRFQSELQYIQNHWQKYIANDPAYNPYLTLSRENFSIKEFNRN